MVLKESIQKIKTNLMETASIHEQSTDLFRALDVDKVVARLDLSAKGTEHGSQNLPDSNDQNFDEVEKAILDLAHKEYDHNKKIFEAHKLTYRMRYDRLSNASDYRKIEIDARNTISDFRKQVDEGRSQLHIVEEPLKETSDERRLFKKKHKLERTAHYSDSGSVVWRCGLIAFLFLLEAFANTGLLAKGSDFGWTGGFTQAILIAFLNIGVAAVTGYLGLRQLWHRNWLRKLLGVLWLSGWVVFTLGFNLLVAHYRDVSKALITDPGIPQQIINEFLANPIGLNDFLSWILCGIGVLFALIAVLDTLYVDDLYPFYGKLDKKYQKLRKDYTNLRSTLIEELAEVKSIVVDDISVAIDAIDRQNKERQAILANRKALEREYESYVEKLQNQCDQLLHIYRSANRVARSTGIPERFNHRTELQREITEVSSFKQMSINTDILSDSLRKTIREFFEAFDSARGEYPPLSVVTGLSDEERATQDST